MPETFSIETTTVDDADLPPFQPVVKKLTQEEDAPKEPPKNLQQKIPEPTTFEIQETQVTEDNLNNAEDSPTGVSNN